MNGGCTHLDRIHDVAPSSWGCEDRLAQGRRDWVHLRVCQECGHVGCCDNSPGRPATAHFRLAGIRSLLAATGADARGLVRSLLVDCAEVYNNTSQTLEATGVADDIERSGRYQALRLRLYRMDREMQRREMRTLAASPDYVVGSLHALTEGGSLLIASASGSQLGPLASGAGHVILVIGAQKIVSDVATGMRRIHEYCYRSRMPGPGGPTECPAG